MDQPSDSALERIRTWPADPGSYPDLMDLVRSIWWAADWGWSQRGRTYSISTGGWSGNEEIIWAMKQNWIFWSQCWWTSRRGGHFVFRLPVYRPAKATKQKSLDTKTDGATV